LLLPSHLNPALLPRLLLHLPWPLLLLLLLPLCGVSCQQRQLPCSHQVEVTHVCCLLSHARLPPLLPRQLPWQSLQVTLHALLLLLL
jgi:hypothetical protein